jgi:hypothetical protein
MLLFGTTLREVFAYEKLNDHLFAEITADLGKVPVALTFMIVNHQLDVRSIAFLANHFFKWA